VQDDLQTSVLDFEKVLGNKDENLGAHVLEKHFKVFCLISSSMFVDSKIIFDNKKYHNFKLK